MEQKEENIQPWNKEGEITNEQLNKDIEELCMSKAMELHLLGYEQVTGEEVWNCVNEQYIKQGVPALHQVVNDILSLKATKFMNWMTLSAYKGMKI